MKTLKRSLAALALLIFLFNAPALSTAQPDPLDPWYRGYNVAFFGGELPDKIIIGHDLHGVQYMGMTDSFNGVYRIELNPDFEPSPKQGRMTLLHEVCHLQLLVEEESEFDQHGKKWQSCMHRLANEGAFEKLW